VNTVHLEKPGYNAWIVVPINWIVCSENNHANRPVNDVTSGHNDVSQYCTHIVRHGQRLVLETNPKCMDNYNLDKLARMTHCQAIQVQ